MSQTPRSDYILMRVEDATERAYRFRLLSEELEIENAKLKGLMRRALPTIGSRITDYADEFKDACR